MKDKKKLDFCCKYCGKRYSLSELLLDGFAVETKCGIVVECPNPKCEQQQLIEE